MIARAENKGSMVFVYNEKNKEIFRKPGEVASFTAMNVTIKQGTVMRIFDEKGKQTSQFAAKK